MGLTLYGTKDALARIKKRGDIGRKDGSGLDAKKTTGANAEKVGDVLRDDPSSSMRGIAAQTKLKRTTVAKILKKKLSKKCLRKVTAQKLADNHPAKRLAACRGFLEEMDRGTLDHRKIF